MCRDLVLARSHDSVFFHCRVWPTDPAQLLRCLAEWPGRPRHVTVPADAAAPAAVQALASTLAGLAEVHPLDYAAPTPEADELGFRLSLTLHEKTIARGA